MFILSIDINFISSKLFISLKSTKLKNIPRYNETTEPFICNCTKPGTFGILCEYQFSNNTFEETMIYQSYLKKKYQIGSQLFGNTTCYKTSFECDYGLMCLDWRHICDGKYFLI